MTKPPGHSPTANGHCPTAPEPFLDERQAMSCIHCGLCLGSCPTYLETGNENDSPRGRIYLMRALQDGRLPLADQSVHHLDLCLGCRACEAACPSGVPYGQLLEHTRDHIEAHHARPWAQALLRRVAIERIFPFPERMELALIPARILRWLRLERWLPKPFREAMSLLPPNLARAELPVRSAPSSDIAPRGRVGFVSGCVMSVMFGPTHQNSVRLLNRIGYEVLTPTDQECCGALFAHSGNLTAARERARRNIEAFERLDCDLIVINAAGCGSTLKEYGLLLSSDPVWVDRAKRFSQKVRDLSEVLVTAVQDLRTGDTPPSPRPLTTCHDACHLAHAQRITAPPRKLVQAVVGESFVELPEADVCCGSAGSYNLTEPAMAARLQERKIQNILKSGAKIVVTTNPGCLLQIHAGLQEAGAHDVRAMHLADFLSEMLPFDRG